MQALELSSKTKQTTPSPMNKTPQPSAEKKETESRVVSMSYLQCSISNQKLVDIQISRRILPKLRKCYPEVMVLFNFVISNLEAVIINMFK